jgi:hypothetical protein
MDLGKERDICDKQATKLIKKMRKKEYEDGRIMSILAIATTDFLRDLKDEERKEHFAMGLISGLNSELKLGLDIPPFEELVLNDMKEKLKETLDKMGISVEIKTEECEGCENCEGEKETVV